MRCAIGVRCAIESAWVVTGECKKQEEGCGLKMVCNVFNVMV